MVMDTPTRGSSRSPRIRSSRNTAASIFASLSTPRTFFNVSGVVESRLNMTESTPMSQKNSASSSVSVSPLVFIAMAIPRRFRSVMTSRKLGISSGSP